MNWRVLSLLIFAWTSALLTPGCGDNSSYLRINLDVSPDKLPYRWETIHEFQPQDPTRFNHYLFEDLNGDGASERILWYNDVTSPGRIISALVYYEDPLMAKARWQDNSNTGCEIKNVSFFDLDGDGLKEIFVSKVAGDSIFFRVTNVEMELIREFLVDVGRGLAPRKGWILNICALGTRDLNHDGYSELIYTLDAKPDSSVQRAVVAYDIKAGKELWRYLIAGHVTPLIFHTACSSDGKTGLLVFCINSYANRYAANRMDDLHSYVVALDFSGRELWRQTVGGAFSMPRCALADIDSDGRKEILVGQSSYASAATDSFQILCFDATTGDLEAASPKFAESTTDLEFYRSDDFPRNRVTACQDPGRLLTLNAHLEILEKSNPANISEMSSCEHLLDDSTSLWLCTTKDGRLAAFDSRWRILAIYKGAFSGDLRYPFLVTENKRGVLVKTESGFALISLAKINSFAVLFAKYRWWLVLIGAAGLFYIMNVGVRKVRDLYLSASGLPSLDKLQIGVMVLNQKGRVLFSNNNPVIKQLTDEEKNSGRDYRTLFGKQAKAVKDAIQSSYENHLFPYEAEVELESEGKNRRFQISIFPRIDQNNKFKGKVVTIEDLTDRPSWKKTIVLGEAAQKWMHHLKTNLATAKLAVENLQQSRFYANAPDPQPIDTYLGDIKAELSESTDIATKILRFLRMATPDLSPCDVNGIIKKALSRYQSYKPKGIEIKTELQSDLPLIQGDPPQLGEALDNLFSNAMNAMEDGGKLIVSTKLASKLHPDERGVEEESEEYLEIDVKDTGCGIKQEDQEKIFEPGFSKSGTGIGLAIVKEVVIKHKGRIDLISKPGEGSTFIIFLPTNRSEA